MGNEHSATAVTRPLRCQSNSQQHPTLQQYRSTAHVVRGDGPRNDVGGTIGGGRREAGVVRDKEEGAGVGGGRLNKLSWSGSDGSSDGLAATGRVQQATAGRRGSIAAVAAAAYPSQPSLKSSPSHGTHHPHEQQSVSAGVGPDYGYGHGYGYGVDEENQQGDDIKTGVPQLLPQQEHARYARVARRGVLGKAQSQLQFRLSTPPPPPSTASTTPGTFLKSGAVAESTTSQTAVLKHSSIAGSRVLPVNSCAKGPPRGRRMSMVEEWAMNNRLREGMQLGGGGSGDTPTDTSPSSSRRPSRTPTVAATTDMLDNYRRFSRGSCLPSAGATATSGGEMSGSMSSLTTESTGPTLAEHLRLSAYQVMALQQSWARMKSTSFQQIFKQLSQKNTTAKELFQKMSILEGFSSSSSHHHPSHPSSTAFQSSSSSVLTSTAPVRCCDQREHLRLLTDLLETSIQEVGNSPFRRVQSNCFRVGEAHAMAFGASYNAASTLWDDLGDCLTDVATKSEPIRGKREAFRAWISLISFLVDSMKAGYTAQYKRSSTRSSNGQLVAAAHRSSLASNNDEQSPPPLGMPRK